jgi:hypothetical protein
MRRALLLLLCFLVVVPPAQAKGPVSVAICGVSGCEKLGTSSTHPGDSRNIASALLNWTGFEPAPIPAPGRFYALELRSRGLPDQESFSYVPAEGVLAAGRTLWLSLPPGLAARLRAAARAVEPWPWLGLRRVSVGERNAPDPAPYVQLFRPLPEAESPPYDAARIPIRADPHWLKHPRYPGAPWSSERVKMEWYPGQGVLYREGEWLRVPTGLAARLQRDAGRVRQQAIEPTRIPWALAGAASALAVAAGLLVAPSRLKRFRAAACAGATTPRGARRP